MVDIPDCILAFGGNSLTYSIYQNDFFLRKGVVGVFESISNSLDDNQKDWINKIHNISSKVPHPRDYIHGVIFLFRKPKNTAALVYDLFSQICINNELVNLDEAQKISNALYRICSKHKQN